MNTVEPSAVTTEFQRGRSRLWRNVRWWALGLVPLFVAVPLLRGLEKQSPLPFWAVILPLGCLAFFSGYRIVTMINNRYKCPACGKLVTEGDGIALNPRDCPHCGTALTEQADDVEQRVVRRHMKRPPPTLDSANVLEFAILDESVHFTGALHLYRGDTRVGAVPALAICRDPGIDGLLLFHCDENWNVVAAQIWNNSDKATIATVAEVKDKAAKYYSGISSRWQTYYA
jgi:hypothetical protein